MAVPNSSDAVKVETKAIIVPFPSTTRQEKPPPGPGSYHVQSPFQPKILRDLSKAGYYVVFQNGKLFQRKQPLYADETERIRGSDLEFDSLPAPGYYYTETHNKALKVYVGPGSYNTESKFVKPRVKGVTEWHKPPAGMTRTPKKSELELEETVYTHETEENYNENYKKNVKGPVVPKSPRFYNEESESSDLSSSISDENPGPGHYIGTAQLSTLKLAYAHSFPKKPRFVYKELQKTQPENESEESKPKEKRIQRLVKPPPKKRHRKKFESPTPGPGTYLENDASKRKRRHKSNIPLGGIAVRSTLDFAKVGFRIAPGPGAYNPEKEKNSPRSNPALKLRKPNRFMLPKEDKSFEPKPLIEHQPDPNSIGVNTSRIKKGGGNNIFRFVRVRPTGKPGFNSGSPRFNKSKPKEIPGPCYYKVSEIRTERNVYVSKIGKDLDQPLVLDRDEGGSMKYLKELKELARNVN